MQLFGYGRFKYMLSKYRSVSHRLHLLHLKLGCSHYPTQVADETVDKKHVLQVEEYRYS